MSAKNIPSDRKRSRPVEKRKKTDIFKKNKFVLAILIFVIIIAIVASAYLLIQNLSEDSNGTTTNGTTTNGDDYTNVSNPIAVFDTSLGAFKIELYEDKVPITVGNFVKLVNDGFYNGMTFYRISDNFMIQAGRYFPDGSEQFSPYGTIEFETHEDVKHVDGAISMASTGAGVGGSNEFFICDGEQSFLDGNYAPFGVVIDNGIDVVRNIAAKPHDNSNPAGGGVPLEDIIINRIIIENQ
jgi:peptidyl-prolyl cis-trans isomerase A (cyclophilin A)